MNLIKSFNKLYFNSLIKRRSLLSYRCLTSKINDTEDSDIIDEESIINERQFDDQLNVKRFAGLATDDTKLKEIETILSHYEYQKYSTFEVPTTLSEEQMKNLLEMDNWRHRDKYLKSLFRREINMIISKKVKEVTKAKTKKRLDEKYSQWNTKKNNGIFDEEGNIIYGLWHNCLFTRISSQNTNRLHTHKLKTSALFGQKIVIDMTCDQSMKQSFLMSKLNQLLKTYNTNRRLEEPFDLSFCNLDFDNLVWKAMQKQMHLYSHLPYFMQRLSEKSYLDLFERKSLVYLTPMATKDLEYDCDKTYIISFSDGFDKRVFNQLSARKEFIQLRRLPIDKYVLWSGHTKDLKSYQVLKILYDVRQGVDWRTAIENNVPASFLKPVDVVQKEDNYRLNRKLRKQQINIDLKQIFSKN